MKRILLAGLFCLGFGGPVMAAQSPVALLGGIIPAGASALLVPLGQVLAFTGDNVPVIGPLLVPEGGLAVPGVIGTLINAAPIPSIGIIGDILNGGLSSGGGFGLDGILGGAGGLPIIGDLLGGGLLGGDGGLPIVGNLLGGGLLGGAGNLPVIGVLLGGDSGLSPDLLLGLLDGLTLPGLPI